MTEIRIKIDSQRMQELVTVDEYIALEEGRVKGVRNVVANFMTDENGVYLPKKEAEKILGSMKLGEITKVSQQFIEAVQEAAGVNPKVETESIKPTSEG
jgi:hypothetical protein